MRTLIYLVIAQAVNCAVFRQQLFQDQASEDDKWLAKPNEEISVEQYMNYESKKDTFLDNYFGESYFGNYQKEFTDLVENNSHIWSKNFIFPDKDDISDIISGNSDRYTSNPLSGFLTFAHSEMRNCYTGTEGFDIAIVGATFDTGVSYRPGARFGPMGIRSATKRMSAKSLSPFRKKFNLFKECKVVDCGDPPMTPIDNRVAIDQLYRAQRSILKKESVHSNLSNTPRILTLGGDHTITLSCLKAVYEKWGQVAVIHFDSHLDSVDPYYMNPNVTEYAALNHGTFFHWAARRGLISSDNNIHVGLRGYYENVNDTLRDTAIGFQRIMSRDIDDIGVTGIIKKIKERVGNNKVYITVDVDCLDPSVAPGTGTVEPGGFTTRELLTILGGLEGLQIIGADIVEVSPIYDQGEITTAAASEIGRSLLELMTITPIS
ncbi:uncharacterized protein PRCAT00004253001 [Priceomyces carsonii]|uniref:uncharacterized protein n=1 Tax=Priceomyces carsonii TaxID=28549 RepID=UPI002EDA83FB|nr:unnamed protein product [Priceomyces carsonii]